MIPVALLFLDIKTAIFLVACFHLFNNSFKVKLFWQKIDFNVFLLFGVPSIIFAFVGARLISVVPIGIIRKTMAIFIIVFSLHSLYKPKFQVKKSTLNAVIGGSCSGFMAGLIGLGGAIRSTFLIVFGLPKEVYVGTSAMIAFVIDLTRIPTYLATGVVEENFRYIVLPFLVLSAYFGVKIGKALLNKISQTLFRKIVLIALLLVGIKLLF